MKTTGEADRAPGAGRRQERPAGPSAARPLGNRRQGVQQDEEGRRGRRREALRLRGWLHRGSSVPRQRKCGRVALAPQGGAILRVSEEDGQRRAGVAGLIACGLGTCPSCARKIAASRAADVAHVLKAAADRGCSVMFVTLTFRHTNPRMPLRASWDVIGYAWRAATSGAGWQKDKGTFGVVGYVRTVELSHGWEHGHHPHVHALVVLDSLTSPEMMQELGGRMFDRWQRALGRKGFTAIADKGGLDARPVQLTGDSIEATAAYISKASFEAVSHGTKQGRGGNRSPFQILADAVETANADDIELFWEIEQASLRRNRIAWSQNLREWAGLGSREKTDEEIAQQNQHGQNVLIIPRDSWQRTYVQLADLLDMTELHGVDGAKRWLRSRGLTFLVPGGTPGRPPDKLSGEEPDRHRAAPDTPPEETRVPGLSAPLKEPS